MKSTQNNFFLKIFCPPESHVLQNGLSFKVNDITHNSYLYSYLLYYMNFFLQCFFVNNFFFMLGLSHRYHAIMHKQGPCTTKGHAQPRAMHNQGPCTTKGHAQPRAMHNQGPCTCTKGHAQPRAMHKQGPCTNKRI